MKHFSRIFACVFTAVLLLTVAQPAPAVSYGEYGDFSYKIDGNKVSLWHYDGPGGSVNVPARLGTIPVGILDNVLFADNLKVSSITVGYGIEELGDYVFTGAKSLSSINLPDSISVIGDAVFKECISLSAITLPAALQHIPEQSFYECTSLEKVTLPSDLRTVGDLAFYNCLSIRSITFPSSLQSIGMSAFAYCSSLTDITIPGSVQVIGSGAFKDCVGLKSVVISPGVRSIGTLAFNNCPSLSEVYIPNTVVSMTSSSVFYNSPNVTICAPAGSYAQTYAKQNNIKFRAASETPTTTTDKPASPVPSEQNPSANIGAVSGLNTTPLSYNKVQLTWDATPDAKGYEVYYSTDNIKYKKATTAKRTSYSKTGLKIGEKYYFKVRAYKTEGSKKIYGDYSDVVSYAPAIPKVNGVKAKAGTGKVSLSWKRNPGASGYEILAGTTPNNLSKVGTTSGRTSFSHKNLNSGAMYYYQIKPFKKVKGNIIYGEPSDVTPVAAK